MKIDRLKPYVYKVKGAKNYALYDTLNGKLCQVTPGGNLEELQKALKEEGLIFDTGGVVPSKLKIDVEEEWKSIKLRELQIRISGSNNGFCWKQIDDGPYTGSIDFDILNILPKELQDIPVVNIRLESVRLEMERILKIIREIDCERADLKITNEIDKSHLKEIEEMCRQNDKVLTFTGACEEDMDIRELRTDAYHFFYSKYYNPCLGHKAAIDTDGSIKPCLWSDDILGNLKTDNLKDMIISGIFDKYWNMTTDKIEVCKDCEKRYACTDCRVSSLRNNGSFNGKPSFCNYDPYKGE